MSCVFCVLCVVAPGQEWLGPHSLTVQTLTYRLLFLVYFGVQSFSPIFGLSSQDTLVCDTRTVLSSFLSSLFPTSGPLSFPWQTAPCSDPWWLTLTHTLFSETTIASLFSPSLFNSLTGPPSFFSFLSPLHFSFKLAVSDIVSKRLLQDQLLTLKVSLCVKDEKEKRFDWCLTDVVSTLNFFSRDVLFCQLSRTRPLTFETFCTELCFLSLSLYRTST